MSTAKKGRRKTDAPEGVRRSVRFPAALDATVSAWAAEREVKWSQAIRELAEAGLGGYKPPRRAKPVRATRVMISPELAREIVEIVKPLPGAINRLGNNVNQIARKVNTGERTLLGKPVVTDKTLQALVAEMAELREQGDRIDQQLAALLRGQ